MRLGGIEVYGIAFVDFFDMTRWARIVHTQDQPEDVMDWMKMSDARKDIHAMPPVLRSRSQMAVTLRVMQRRGYAVSVHGDTVFVRAPRTRRVIGHVNCLCTYSHVEVAVLEEFKRMPQVDAAFPELF